VVGRREDPLLAEVVVQIVDVSPAPLDLEVLSLVDREDVDVDSLARVGKPRLDLLRDEEVGPVRVLVKEGEAPVDRVVVRDRHEVHSALAGDPVNLLGMVIGVPGVREAEILEGRENRVAVEVDLLEPGIGEPFGQLRLGPARPAPIANTDRRFRVHGSAKVANRMPGVKPEPGR